MQPPSKSLGGGDRILLAAAIAPIGHRGGDSLTGISWGRALLASSLPSSYTPGRACERELPASHSVY
jgi:hypothetical protein